ncbi:hypothetical protein BDV98DRAFT_567029 [Pterulicium gracile]|uniref:Uncharacterized protein n=1 Tax=Pterulicium gracile TaxID=1884261 RepID=A0A5C3QVD7_9AGAR|nr:hypothetical protein BDV98DRAFT_567029 [Pterula gracilis]
MSVWRSGSRRVLGIVLYFLVFTTFGFWIAFVILTTRFNDAGTTSNSTPYAIVTITNSSVSIAANLMATSMIAFAACEHLVLQSQSGVTMHGARILVLLAESGIVYVLIQIIRLALTVSIVPSTVPYGPLDTANMTFGRATTMVTISGSIERFFS